MKLIKALTLALSVSVTGVSVAHADFDDYIEAKAYQDPKFDSIVAKAVQIVKNKGYEIGEVDVDTRFGKPVLQIDAYKNYGEFELVFSYPELNLISERRD